MSRKQTFLFLLVYWNRSGKLRETRLEQKAYNEHEARRTIIQEQLRLGHFVRKLKDAEAA